MRGADGEVRAFLNKCAHRGAQLCQQDSGSAREFMCPYHQWVYDLNGKLTGISLRVPVPAGSITDLVATLSKNVTKDEVNAALKQASQTSLKGILEFIDRLGSGGSIASLVDHTLKIGSRP